MIELGIVESYEEFQQLMPLFLKGYREMNKRNKAFDCDEEGFIKVLAWVLGTGPRNGILVAYVEGEAVGYGVGYDSSPLYAMEKQYLLWALYCKPEWSKLVVKVLLNGAEAHAKAEGYKVLKAYNGRLNGSSFNFFEKVLGFRRNKMEFIKHI